MNFQVQLNGQHPLTLMFHTAASGIAIIEESAENIFRLDSLAGVEAKSWGGGGESKYVEHNSLRIGQLNRDSLFIWIDKRSGRGTDGKFGPNFFGDKIIEVIVDQGVLCLHEQIPADLTEKGYKAVAISFERGMMFLEWELSLDGKTYSHPFLLHSGYSGSLLFDDAFAAEHGLGEKLEILKTDELQDSYGNVLKTQKAIWPQMKLSDQAFEDVPVSFFEGALGRQKYSVMGGELIKRFNFFIDRENALMYLAPNSLAYTDFPPIKD
ncbi:MAG: hypothetical protein AAF696_21705 [Bacteroidota bacterium]